MTPASLRWGFAALVMAGCVGPPPGSGGCVPACDAPWHEATLHADCHVHFDGRFYSAPSRLVGAQLWVHATPSTVAVFNGTARAATHDRRGPERRSTCEEHRPEGRRDYRHRTREHWTSRARALGDEVAAYVEAVFASDDSDATRGARSLAKSASARRVPRRAG